MIRALTLLLFVMFAPHAHSQAVTAGQHNQKAVAFVRSGDLERAEAELRQAVALAPDNPEYLSTLGSILGMRQKLDESSRYFEKALELNPKDWATRRNLASNQFQTGQLELARKNLDTVLLANARDATAVLLSGMVAEELGDYPTAIRRLASVPDVVRKRPQSVAALARAYYRTGAKENARAALAVLDRAQGSEGVFLGAEIAAAASDFETADRMFASIRSEYPDREKLEYELALVEYRTNRFDESLATLRGLTDHGHQTSDIFNLMAWCFYKQGNFKDSVAAMDMAIEREPAKETNYVDLGMILLSHRRFDVALEVATKAVAVAPESYQAHMLKGLVEARMSHLNDAGKTYARAVELNPKAPEALLALALVESANEKRRQSQETFEQALKKFPRHGVIYQEYARMLLKFASGADPAAKVKAASLLRDALLCDDSLAESHYQLGALAQNDGDLASAIQHLETAARLKPASSKVHFVLARAYRRAGRAEQASKEIAAFQQLKAEEEKSAAGAVNKGATPDIPDLPPPESTTDLNQEPR